MGKVLTLRKAMMGQRLRPSATRGLRAAAGRPTSYDPKTRTFEFVLASEKPCRTWRWGRSWDFVEVDEILPMSGLEDVASIAGAPILDSHSSRRLFDVVGVVESAKIEGTQLVCRGRLSERDDVADIARDLETGILNSFSVGFQILEDGVATERKNDVPLVTVKRWKALEASLVAVPADDTAKIRSGARRPSSKRTGASDMDAETLKLALIQAMSTAITTAIDTAADDDGDADADLEAAVEEFRAAEIAKRAAKGKTPAAPSAPAERSAAEKAQVLGLRTACAKRGLAAEFDALEKSGAEISELRNVLVAGLRTNKTEVDGTQTPANEAGGKGQRGKLARESSAFPGAKK